MVSLTLPGERDALLSPTAETAGKVHVQIRGLSKRYPGQTQEALKAVDLQVKRGEIFGIIGRSGAGKSTLIRCLNRLENPTSGQVVIDGIDLGSLSDRQLVDWRRRTGMIFQHFNLLSAKTVRENIELPMKVAGVPAAERRRKVDELLALVGLEQRQHAWPAQLSGGQKQRVGIARALVHDLCHQVAVIDQGEIIERGPVWQVYSDPQQETTRQLLNPQFSALPEAIQPLLTPTRQRADSRLLVRLRYTGQGALPDLAALSTRVGGELTLLFSAVEWVDGKPTGQMLLLLDARHESDAVRALLTPVADQLEIPGYVTGY